MNEQQQYCDNIYNNLKIILTI